MGKLVEGLWDCPYCDTTSIKASQKLVQIAAIRRMKIRYFVCLTPSVMYQTKMRQKSARIPIGNAVSVAVLIRI